jgi:DNA-binding IclR family transcriptional regulator
MLSVLEFFDDAHPSHSAESLAEVLNVSLPTIYRYVRLLVDAGLLQRVAESRVALGPRIIVLDHHIRQADPVLRHGAPFMAELVTATGFDCVISALYGDQLLDTHREYSQVPATLSYGRGRPRPLFLGAAPKAILSRFSPARLRKLFDRSTEEIAAAGLPAEWSAFRRYFAQVRKAGYYLSSGELEPQLAALAAPMLSGNGDILGAISVVTSVDRMAMIDLDKLATRVMRAADDIAARAG